MQQTILLLGGTGFVGRHIGSRLDPQEYQLRVVTRDAGKAGRAGLPANAELVEADIYEDQQLDKALEGCSVAINLVGILNEKGHDGSEFRKVHAELPARLAAACLRTGVKRLVHMSALHADANNGPSLYLRSKGAGEEAVHAAAGDKLVVTSFQPSVIFGEGDSFINRFASLLKITPLVFPLACPEARFAPVYVGDVADRFIAAIGDDSTYGRRIQLCGPREYSLIELVRYTATAAGRRRLIVGLPDAVSRMQASVLEWVPGKPFSLDNYASLSVDSTCSNAQPEPTTLESTVPGYIR